MTVLFASLKFETVAPGHLISSGNRECLIMVSRFSFLFGTFGWGRGYHFFSYSLRRISEIWNCQ